MIIKPLSVPSPSRCVSSCGGCALPRHHATLCAPPQIAPSAVRELAKEDYSYEALRIASDNWMEPVIVRGLFSDVAAVNNWPLPGGLNALDPFSVSVVQNSTRGKDHWINCG